MAATASVASPDQTAAASEPGSTMRTLMGDDVST
jgi:hypothetical protein